MLWFLKYLLNCPRYSYVAIVDVFQKVNDVPVIFFFFLSNANRISDLRVVDLLDGLCDRMQDYTLQKVSRVLEELLLRLFSNSNSFAKFQVIIN